MDTTYTTPTSSRRAKYRRHPTAFKRSVVLQSLEPGASVSRLARQHDINANQIFAWRKAYRDGAYAESSGPMLLPVTLASPAAPAATAIVAPTANNGTIELNRDGVSLRIDGRPDPDTLRLILAHWLP